jgi:hypothetical protein
MSPNCSQSVMLQRHQPQVSVLGVGTARASNLGLGLVLVGECAGGNAAPETGSGDSVDERVVQSQWLSDGHPDPDVGRVLQHVLLERAAGIITLSTNSIQRLARIFHHGLAWPPVPGLLRVLERAMEWTRGAGRSSREGLPVCPAETLAFCLQIGPKC